MNITLCVGDLRFFLIIIIPVITIIYSMGYQLYITKTSKEQAQVIHFLSHNCILHIKGSSLHYELKKRCFSTGFYDREHCD